MFFLLDFTALALWLEEWLQADYRWRDLLDRLVALGLMLTLAWWLYSWRWGWQLSQLELAALGLLQALYIFLRLQGKKLAPGWLVLLTWLAHAGRGLSL